MFLAYTLIMFGMIPVALYAFPDRVALVVVGLLVGAWAASLLAIIIRGQQDK